MHWKMLLALSMGWVFLPAIAWISLNQIMPRIFAWMQDAGLTERRQLA